MNVFKIMRPELQALPAHADAASTDLIKLDSMENPYPLPISLQAELNAQIAEIILKLNRYPDVHATALKAAVRDAMKIPDELDILLGNGSDEIIQMIALACARPGATLLSLAPSFAMFERIAVVCGLRYLGVPLTPEFEIDVAATLACIAQYSPTVLFIAYPNNPTGNLFDREAIRAIIRAASGLIVLDEAYFAFSPESFLDEIANYSNVILMRTVSKLGLAGLRLGILIGRCEWLREIEKLRLPYNNNSLTQAAARFALHHYDALCEQALRIIAERERLTSEIRRLPEITAYHSSANFILVRVRDSERTFRSLLSRKILVKQTGTLHPLLANTLRLTVGTPSENDVLIAALREAC